MLKFLIGFLIGIFVGITLMCILQVAKKESERQWFYEEEKQHDKYGNSLGSELGYTGENCINCGRNRVIKYSKGKRICEKCSYDQDKKEYDFEYNKYI